jgi:hypothetical protein
MAIYQLTDTEIQRVKPTTFSKLSVDERYDLQRILRDNVGVLAPDVLVISEEFGRRDEPG